MTTRIIDGLVPRFGSIRAKIIGGYLSDSDQFWKVNYHWEYLLQMVAHSLTLPIEDADAKELVNIRSNLMACKPSPESGYTSSPVGKPEDRTSYDEAIQRYTVVRSMKESFVKVTNRADLKRKSTRSASMFDLAGAPVAHPGRASTEVVTPWTSRATTVPSSPSAKDSARPSYSTRKATCTWSSRMGSADESRRELRAVVIKDCSMYRPSRQYRLSNPGPRQSRRSVL